VSVQGPAPDSVRAALHDVFADPRYDWTEQGGLFALLARWWRALQEWLAGLQSAHPLAYYVLVIVAAALLLAILTHFAYLTWRALHPRAPLGSASAKRALQVRDAAWHRAAYARLLAGGRYAEALAERFAALVCELHERAVVRLDPAKTPAEYAAEARLDTTGRGMLATLVDELYLRVFGGVECLAEDVTQFDERATALARYHAAS
jgi:hypothetical protein